VRFTKLRFSSKYLVQVYSDQYLRATPILGRKIVKTSGAYFGYLGDWLSVLKNNNSQKHFS